MLQGSLFAGVSQPLKGVLSAGTAALIGVPLGTSTAWPARSSSDRCRAGAPGFEHEIWLVNALLSVTFPCLVYLAAFFDFWPFGAAENTP